MGTGTGCPAASPPPQPQASFPPPVSSSSPPSTPPRSAPLVASPPLPMSTLTPPSPAASFSPPPSTSPTPCASEHAGPMCGSCSCSHCKPTATFAPYGYDDYCANPVWGCPAPYCQCTGTACGTPT